MTKVHVSRFSLLLGLSLGVAGTLLAQHAVGVADAGKPKAQTQGPLERKEFHETLDVVLDRYVEPVDTPTVMASGLKHMLSGLDPYSHYLTADERARAQKLHTQGAEVGLVTALHRGQRSRPSSRSSRSTPAAPRPSSGLLAGDHILAIRGHACAGLLSNVEAQLLLSGAAGEQIELVLDRGQRSRADPGRAGQAQRRGPGQLEN